MILVTGTVVVRAEMVGEAVALSLEHVHRSRGEPGCLSHDVALDAENPNRLMFTERWEDAAALRQHFSLDASRNFGKALAAFAAAPASMQVYEAAATRV